MPRGGYAWWYADAISDDGAHAITLIAFVGSVFSPWYFAARRWGRADPENHCTLNVLLRAPGRNRFAMTERGRAAVSRDATRFAIGPSALEWDGTALRVAIRERGAPIPWPVRGEVRIIPSAITADAFTLESGENHAWWPIAPRCRVEVELTEPALRWRGDGYLDSNFGARAMEADFSHWDWSCARRGADEAAILYETWRRDGTTDCLALAIDRAGAITPFAPPGSVTLPKTAWRLARRTRAEHVASVRTVDDTPFYARSVLQTRLLGEDVVAMHETLSLDRFRTPWMQAMLPFRMRRG